LVALLPSNPMLIVTKKAVPTASLTELIGWLKSSPGKLVAGTAGAGSGSHLAGVYFQNITGTRFQFVPYRGTGPAMSDLVAGHIDLMFDQASEALEQVRAGTIRAYAVTAKKRLTSSPDIPTVDEAGAPGLYISLWSGLWVPKGTRKEVVIKLNAAVVDTSEPFNMSPANCSRS
jgi:tripartite-type tricarboxylate transporter receptor subunit TctC